MTSLGPICIFVVKDVVDLGQLSKILIAVYFSVTKLTILKQKFEYFFISQILTYLTATDIKMAKNTRFIN